MIHTDQWLKAGKHLPAPLRDFHDQKDVFKAMHSLISPDNLSLQRVSWVDGQCYVIDIFLWFMARRGWTLQRVRAKGDFRDLGADVKAVQDAETGAFQEYLIMRKQP